MNPVKILAFAGSLRKDSLNKKLIKVAVEGARKAGGDVTLIDLCDFPMPLYDQEIEDQEGLPENVVRFKELMSANQGLLIASPEYNSTLPGVLKNVIDWTSRKATPDEPNLQSFKGKTAVLMSASPSFMGGLRCLAHLRAILASINVLLLPQQITISSAHNAFTSEGSFNDPKQQQAVENLGATLVQTLIKLA